LHDVITEAFSKDIGSAGKFSFFQLALIASVVKILSGSILAVIGIYLAWISVNQTFYHRLSLNLAENGAIYETKAEAKRASPIQDLIFSFKNRTKSPQRLFSPDNPLTKFSAASNFWLHLSASSSTIFFCSYAISDCL